MHLVDMDIDSLLIYVHLSVTNYIILDKLCQTIVSVVYIISKSWFKSL